MPDTAKIRNRLLVFGAALLFSTGGAAIKATSLTSWQVAGFRSGIAAVLLYALIPGARPGRAGVWSRRTWLTGVAYAATLILFVSATKMTTAANAIFLQSTAPLYLLLLGPKLLGERIRRVDVGVMIAVAAGAVLLLAGSGAAGTVATNPARGNLLAVVSGLTWALTIAGLRGESRHGGEAGSAAAIAGNAIAFLVCLPLAVPVVGAAGVDIRVDIGVVLYLGVFQVALAYVLLTRALRHVPGLEASTLLLVEPVFNPFWAWVMQGERPGPLAVAGGALILLAALAGTAWRRGEARLAEV